MKTYLKITLSLFVFLLTLSVVLCTGATWWAIQEFHKAGNRSDSIIIEIPSGSGVSKIAKILHTNQMIEYPLLFGAAARLTGAQSALKAGEYQIPAKASTHDILSLLESGKTYSRRFTVPEGLTSWEITKIIKNVDLLEGEITKIPPDGTLLPETYDYQKTESRENILKRMASAMEEALDSAIAKNCPANKDIKNIIAECTDGLLHNKIEILTLASIIEKETAVPEERKRVAGVFINRLKRGIALQTDPTVIYALTKGEHKNEGMGPLGRRLLKKDLEYDSPYNTYLYPGLPPGPIANPGKASIEAALNPEKHEYIYFVADGSGGHVFAKTLKEHNANVANWRKIRRQKK